MRSSRCRSPSRGPARRARRPALSALRRHRSASRADAAADDDQPVQRRQARRRAGADPGRAGRARAARRRSTTGSAVDVRGLPGGRRADRSRSTRRARSAPTKAGWRRRSRASRQLLDDAVAGDPPRRARAGPRCDRSRSTWRRAISSQTAGIPLGTANCSTQRGMIERVHAWAEAYPIVSVEDGLAEDDWAHWPALREAIGVAGARASATISSARTRSASAGRSTHRRRCALLLKVNQIGTLTEAAEALPAGAWRRLARHGQRPQRRDRGRLAGRPGRRLGRRPDQGRIDHAVRAAGEVQPPARDRERYGITGGPVAK